MGLGRNVGISGQEGRQAGGGTAEGGIDSWQQQLETDRDPIKLSALVKWLMQVQGAAYLDMIQGSR